MVTVQQHWHIWRLAATGRAAFMGRPYTTRASARKAAERWSGPRYRRALTFVHECALAECPRPPEPAPPLDDDGRRDETRRPAI